MSKIKFLLASLLTLAYFTGVSLAQQGDAGQFIILSAQYGTAAHHVDVTGRLRELARQDRMIGLSNRTFGIDPDPDHHKVVRIFARTPNGQERFFEYQEGGVIDGSLFRGWSGGNWEDAHWNGSWEGTHYESQPAMVAAIQHLREAQQNLQAASEDKGGHRVRALQLIEQAMRETQEGMRYDNNH